VRAQANTWRDVLLTNLQGMAAAQRLAAGRRELEG
jgi:hypothetical protein